MAAKTLPSQAYLRECFDYDPASGRLTWRVRPREHFATDPHWKTWNTRFAAISAGTIGDRNRIRVTINYNMHTVSRVIWKIMTGIDPIAEIDHRDTNPSNNIWENLREATTSQNEINKSGLRDGLKGAYRHKSGRWRSEIRNNGIVHYLGFFDTEAEAHAAYVRSATELHGEFANTKSKGED